jgi:hypothetical protein
VFELEDDMSVARERSVELTRRMDMTEVEFQGEVVALEI